MAATDATVFPAQDLPYRLYLSFRDQTGEIISGWTGAASVISIDGAASAAGPTPTEDPSADGMGWIDLTSAQMNGRVIGVQASVTNAGAKKYQGYVITGGPQEISNVITGATTTIATAVWNVTDYGDAGGRGGALGQMVSQLWRRFYNKHSNDGSTQTVYKDDSATPMFSASVGSSPNSIGKSS